MSNYKISKNKNRIDVEGQCDKKAKKVKTEKVVEL
jgi:hypothetical protein